MSYIKTLLRIVVAAIAALQLSACSKTVQWEEEVILNTGETIWVKRTDTFRRSAEPGNPLRASWWPKSRSIQFTWLGKPILFQTETTQIFRIQVLEPPDGLAVVAWTGPGECAKRGYGEYRWLRGKWQLQREVSRSLLGQERNLMSYYSATDGSIPLQVSSSIRLAQDNVPNRGSPDLTLVPARVALNCNPKEY